LGPEKSRYYPAAKEAGVQIETIRPRDKLKLIRGIARAIRQHDIEVVHAHHGRDYWPAILGARLSNRHPQVILNRHLASSPGAWISRQAILSQCDAMVAVSRFVEKLLREGANDPGSREPERRRRPPVRGDLSKVRMVYGGIDTARFAPLEQCALRAKWNLSPEHYVFGVVGAYNKPRGKGQREFLQAAARVQAKLPCARFLIIGAGTLGPTLKEDIARLGLEGKAWLTPFCTDMPQGMNAIDCLVHPAVGSEALGLAVLEAAACGRPVIASDIDGIPEALIHPDFGALIPAGSVDALEEAMLDWASRPRWDMARRMEVHTMLDQRFSLQSAARRYLDLYQELAGNAAQAAPDCARDKKQ
jgi:glycosyltransferase involved in cell wall biosynthesis